MLRKQLFIVFLEKLNKFELSTKTKISQPKLLDI